MQRLLTIALLFITLTHTGRAADLVWYDGSRPVTVKTMGKTDPVVTIAMQMFADDMQKVTGKAAKCIEAGQATIRLYQMSDRTSRREAAQLRQAGIDTEALGRLTDGFAIAVHDGHIYVAGQNGRGVAYGLLELSRMAGVSPWVWWGDVTPRRRDSLRIPYTYRRMEGASVEYRGVFINDEDWTLRPWSYGNYEKAEFGTIGPRTNKRIFQLLLRLRANAIWPAMHTGTKAFFANKANKLMADSCGIVIGTSHCEPMLRNNLEEWDVKRRGAFNYMTNREQVQDYWAERLKEVAGSKDNMFTIGMRGIHDGSMEGVKTMEEKTEALQRVIDDQQVLLSKYIGPAEKQMQVFVPYKEVLDIYNRGLKVPDNATLMWCDDNYGYMTRLSNQEEQKRQGGAGVYYHLSYWGRPHDYMWLTTTQPGLIYNEMKTAYDYNARKLWIVNVHDPKVAAYDLELFLDLAWNINSVGPTTVGEHMKQWLTGMFGAEVGEAIYPAMREFYRLTGQRKPEMMGWSQVEVDKKRYNRGLSGVQNTEFSLKAFGGELDRYMERYNDVVEQVEQARGKLPAHLDDAYFAAIVYPVKCAALQATKMLEAQKARMLANGSTLKGMFASQDKLYRSVARSQRAYQTIRQLTDYYNKQMAGGKWDRCMHMRPRDLPSTAAPVLPTLLTDGEVEQWLKTDTASTRHPLKRDGSIARNACEWTTASEGCTVVDMLGHSLQAVSVPKGGRLTFDFKTEHEGEAKLTLALIPTQPNDTGDLRFAVSIDGGEETVYSLKERFRSEEWKLNVMRGQARRQAIINLPKGPHTLTLRALDDHIVFDQWMLDPDTQRTSYLIF